MVGRERGCSSGHAEPRSLRPNANCARCFFNGWTIMISCGHLGVCRGTGMMERRATIQAQIAVGPLFNVNLEPGLHANHRRHIRWHSYAPPTTQWLLGVPGCGSYHRAGLQRMNVDGGRGASVPYSQRSVTSQWTFWLTLKATKLHVKRGAPKSCTERAALVMTLDSMCVENAEAPPE